MSNDAALVLPALTVSGEGVQQHAADLVLPALTVSASGETGKAGAAALSLPALTTSGQLQVQNYGTAALTLPALSVSASDGAVALRLPALSVAAEGFTGNIGQAALLLPAPVVLGSGTTNLLGTSGLSLPALRASGEGFTGNYAQGALSLPRLQVAAEGLVGNVGTVDVAIPVLQTQGVGYYDIVGYAAIALPALTMRTAAAVAGSDGADAWSLQLKGLALTRYTGYGFNSLATFEGVHLGAMSDGIYVLEGADDDGQPIAAVVQLAKTDFGTPQVKRMDSAWVGYTATGEMQLTVTAGEQSHTYDLIDAGRTDAHNQRVKIGQGLKGRYWDATLANRDGSDFQLDTLELVPLPTPQRHGG